MSSFEMDKSFQQCVAIKFSAKFGFNMAKTFKMMVAMYRKAAESCSTVKCRHRQFTDEREFFKDEKQSGRQKMMKMDVNVARVAAIV